MASETEILNDVYDQANHRLQTTGGGSQASPNISGLEYNSSAPTLSNGGTDALQGDANANLKVTMATALSQAIDSVLTYQRGSNYVNLTASGLVLTGAGKLTGIWVSSASATPTIKVWDNTAASGTVLLNTFTPTAATFYQLPYIRVGTGIYVTISGTVDCTVCYDPTTT